MAKARHPKRKRDQREDERDQGNLLDDWQAASELQSILTSLAPVTGLRVDVDVDQGVVYLRGEVASPWQKELAERIVREARSSGVREVRNELVVNPVLPPLFRP